MTEEKVVISAPDYRIAGFTIIGNAPLVMQKFSAKARQQMMDKQMEGSKAKKGKNREPRDFDADYKAAWYRSKAGWYGFSAASLRAALISACRMVGFKMTLGKLSLFVEPDGFDTEDSTPLVKITKGEPHCDIRPARNETGVIDLRARPMWVPGWEAKPRVKFDGSMFSLTDISNLLMRAGIGGICEGRPDSKRSCGCGWGTFDIHNGKEKA